MASASDELKKQHPNLEKFWPYIDYLNAESDRGKVLISSGYLEEQLKQILLAFMLKSTVKKEIETTAAFVEGGNAPLGTLSARITACYLLGLISRNESDDLHQIRHIRNAFAHEMETTFATQSVVSRCAQLHLAKGTVNMKLSAKAIAGTQFTNTAIALIANLTNRPYYVSKERRTSRKWPPLQANEVPMKVD
jgi:mannitol operon repressor